jgi:hypothetical protein
MKNLGNKTASFVNKNDNMVLGAMILYLLFDVRTPNMVNNVINNTAGLIVFIVLGLSVLTRVKNECLMIVGLLVMYELVNRARKSRRDGRVLGIGGSHSGNSRMNSGFSQGYTLEEAMSNEVPNNNRKPMSTNVEPLNCAPTDAAVLSN